MQAAAAIHWDDVPESRRDAGEVHSAWRDLATAAGATRVGIQLVEIEPRCRSAAPHVHADSEEMFVVLEGDGEVWLDGQSFPVAAGDVVLHRVREEAHTLRAGEGGVRILACGPRPANLTWWPRLSAGRVGAGTAPVDTLGREPWRWEEEMCGPLAWPDQPGERPEIVTNFDDLQVERRDRGESHFSWRNVGTALGARDTALRLIDIDPGAMSFPPHCHSSEEELFVVIDGGGTLVLGDDERHELRTGSVVARPPATGVAHTFLGGEDGMRLIAYSDSDPNDMAWLPRSRKLYFRAFDLLIRAEPLDYWAGEDE
jgi:uncharacterized cupin superfamily protein